MAEGTNNNEEFLSATALGSITVDRRRYAVGLQWQPLQNTDDDPTVEIREAMETDATADLYCLRSTATPQYGIGSTTLGHVPGEPSAAAAIATVLGDYTSVAAVFHVNEGWWLVAIRNDLILSEEDRLFETESEARAAYFALMSLPDWDLRIAPEDWGVDKAVQMPLEQLFKRNISRVVLQELSGVKRMQFLLIIALVIGICVLCLIWLAISFWQSAFHEEKIEAVPIPEVIQPVEPAPEKPKPWEKLPKSDVFLYKCWNNAYQLTNLTIPGWRIGNITCTPQGLTTRWSKSWDRGGRIAWLKAALNEYKMSRVDVRLNQDGVSADGKLSFTNIPMVASVPALDQRKLWEELTDIRQATNIRLDFSKESVLDPPNNPDGSRPPNQQEYVFYRFSITSPYTPFEWLTFFEKFPGLELTTINFIPGPDAQDKWKYEGRIYAK